MPRRVTVVWTRPALASLLEIARFIQIDNPSAAQRLASAIKSRVARLQKFPESGRTVPEFPASDLREIIISDYRVIYRYLKAASRVQILVVRHGAQILEPPP